MHEGSLCHHATEPHQAEGGIQAHPSSPRSLGSTLALPSFKNVSREQSSSLLNFSFLSFFGYHLIKKKKKKSEEKQEGLLIHAHLLTCPRVQLQQFCLPLRSRCAHHFCFLLGSGDEKMLQQLSLRCPVEGPALSGGVLAPWKAEQVRDVTLARARAGWHVLCTG